MNSNAMTLARLVIACLINLAIAGYLAACLIIGWPVQWLGVGAVAVLSTMVLPDAHTRREFFHALKLAGLEAEEMIKRHKGD
jgi:fatty acid desaturase